MIAIYRYNIVGGVTNPSAAAMGEYGNIIPTATINNDIITRNLLGLLSMNGLLFVLIICITSVCVINDSKNHPVWKRAAWA